MPAKIYYPIFTPQKCPPNGVKRCQTDLTIWYKNKKKPRKHWKNQHFQDFFVWQGRKDSNPIKSLINQGIFELLPIYYPETGKKWGKFGGFFEAVGYPILTQFLPNSYPTLTQLLLGGGLRFFLFSEGGAFHHLCGVDDTFISDLGVDVEGGGYVGVTEYNL